MVKPGHHRRGGCTGQFTAAAAAVTQARRRRRRGQIVHLGGEIGKKEMMVRGRAGVSHFLLHSRGSLHTHTLSLSLCECVYLLVEGLYTVGTRIKHSTVLYCIVALYVCVVRPLRLLPLSIYSTCQHTSVTVLIHCLATEYMLTRAFAITLQNNQQYLC